MGIYDTPQKDMGRLSYEMWRATRLVVDTGLTPRAGARTQAVAFMNDNSALTDANIDAEVNRYIANPGQALAYKLGELKIRDLRGAGGKGAGREVRPAPVPRRGARPGGGAARRARAQIMRWIAAEKVRA